MIIIMMTIDHHVTHGTTEWDMMSCITNYMYILLLVMQLFMTDSVEQFVPV